MNLNMTNEIRLSYDATNTYSTLNELTDRTKTIWMVFHGMGYLSRFFIKYFKELDPSENYIIAPQAPSKYYLDSTFKHIGASWLTRENTSEEMENVLSYVNSVWLAENLPRDRRLIVVGYSQGVSVATRWMANQSLDCDILVLHSGGIPEELSADKFQYLDKNTQVHYVYGNRDPYITEERILKEEQKAQMLFEQRLQMHPFEGKHVFNKSFIQNL